MFLGDPNIPVSVFKIDLNMQLYTAAFFTTNLLEDGTDLQSIQELPRHKNSKTMEIYTHVSESHI